MQLADSQENCASCVQNKAPHCADWQKMWPLHKQRIFLAAAAKVASASWLQVQKEEQEAEASVLLPVRQHSSQM
jgi:hypothetical protein